MNEIKLNYKNGFIKGIPIGIGYLPVSFTFGLMAAESGLPIWLVIFTSLSNVTSAGQFAGVNLIMAGAGYMEIAITTLVINLRYMLMSLALSQKLEQKIPLWKRMIFGFGITDEVFAIASTEINKITAEYMFGLIGAPIFGWTIGTALGACVSGILPSALQDAMGIALYTMFIAIIVPPAKKAKPIFIVILISVLLTCILKYISWFQFISSGFQTILATVITAGIGAALFPIEEEKNESIC